MKTVLSTQDGQIAAPYCIQLPSPPADGQRVVIQARMVESDETRISFNFGENPDLSSGVLLHFDIRFDEDCVVRNSKVDTEWGEEERDGGMPLTKGEAFEISFLTTSTHYEVFVKGTKFCDYKYRMPIEKAKYFFVYGFVEIDQIKFSDQADIVTDELEIPFQVPISLYTGRKLYFSGFTPKDSDHWLVSLIIDDRPENDSNVALLYNPRFQNFDVNNVVVMNSQIDGRWLDEERSEDMPFALERFFNVTIEVTATGYKISANDRFHYEFRHRADITTVTSLKIAGNVKLRRVDF